LRVEAGEKNLEMPFSCRFYGIQWVMTPLCHLLSKRAFRVKANSNRIYRKLQRRKKRIERRLNRRMRGEHPTPMFAASNIHYDVAERAAGINAGGIGLLAMLRRFSRRSDDCLPDRRRCSPHPDGQDVNAAGVAA
jgi:hypothetical protein